MAAGLNPPDADADNRAMTAKLTLPLFLVPLPALVLGLLLAFGLL
jgi:hypothetical protein